MNINSIGQLTLTLVLAALLFACDDDRDDSPEATTKPTQSLLEMDLSGTWLFTREERYYNRATSDYLYSSYTEYTILLDDAGQTVYNKFCWDFNNQPSSGVKTDNNFYLNVFGDPFTLNSDNIFVRSEDIRNPPDSPNHWIREVLTLQQIFAPANFDSGSLTIAGGFSLTESTNVCLTHSFNSLDAREDTTIIVPHDDDTLSFTLRTTQRLDTATGVYSFDSQSQNQGDLFSIDVSSNATAFNDLTGSNTLAPNAGTVTITNSSETIYSGTFAFTGQDSRDYTGSFDITPQF